MTETTAVGAGVPDPSSSVATRTAPAGGTAEDFEPPGARPAASAGDSSEDIADIAEGAGIRSIDIYAWRDLEHPEAGGSEVHAARLAERWAAAGIDVTLRTSRPAGADRTARRAGYRVLRRGGRYLVFPRVIARGLASRTLAGRGAPAGALVEVWNGMPWFSPLWGRRPRITFLHHVHGGMWDMVMPFPLAALGKGVEARVAPWLYRRETIVTLSESSKREIVSQLGLPPGQVEVVPPGVDSRFRPARQTHPQPLVVAVGRLVPYKRFEMLVETLLRVHERYPTLQAVIAGDGSERPALESLVAARGARGWISLPGRLADEDLVRLYQRAWVLVSTSAYEGWGLTISEAAACGTPAVVTPITGHLDAVEHGRTGYLAAPGEAMAGAVCALLGNDVLRRRMREAAIAKAGELSWDRAAVGSMRALAASVVGPHPPDLERSVVGLRPSRKVRPPRPG